ncbi:MAG: hypothetical protein JJD92_08880 [Frankiaceae bacterium]|nr:hypothetical protein [Frankiaceae bacterium]
MSRLLLVHEGPEGRVDVLLADAEVNERGVRVFCRRGEVVLRVARDEVILVRDVRNRTPDHARLPEMLPNPYCSDYHGP